MDFIVNLEGVKRCDGVVQETEQQITNTPVASSKLPPRHQFNFMVARC